MSEQFGAFFDGQLGIGPVEEMLAQAGCLADGSFLSAENGFRLAHEFPWTIALGSSFRRHRILDPYFLNWFRLASELRLLVGLFSRLDKQGLLQLLAFWRRANVERNGQFRKQAEAENTLITDQAS